jgi:hypothetical protein
LPLHYYSYRIADISRCNTLTDGKGRFGSEPCSRRNFTASLCPFSTAHMSAVRPHYTYTNRATISSTRLGQTSPPPTSLSMFVCSPGTRSNSSKPAMFPLQALHIKAVIPAGPTKLTSAPALIRSRMQPMKSFLAAISKATLPNCSPAAQHNPPQNCYNAFVRSQITNEKSNTADFSISVLWCVVL